jgi:hypothetical protein
MFYKETLKPKTNLQPKCGTFHIKVSNWPCLGPKTNRYHKVYNHWFKELTI